MAKIKNKKTGEIREVSDKELKQYGLGGKLPKAKLGKDVDPFMQNAIGNRINYWEERNANGELPQQINLGNVGQQQPTQPKFVAQDYGDIDESKFVEPQLQEQPVDNSKQLRQQLSDYNRRKNSFGRKPVNPFITGPYDIAAAKTKFDSASTRREDLANMTKPDNMSDTDWSNAVSDEKVGIAGDKMSGAGHILRQAMGDIGKTVGLFSMLNNVSQARKAEMESFNLHNRERAEISAPYKLYGDDSQTGGGTNDPLSFRYGGDLPLAEDGFTDGLIGKIKGNSHENGGTPMNFNQEATKVEHLQTPRDMATVEAQSGEVAQKTKDGGYIFTKEKDLALPKAVYEQHLMQLNDGGFSYDLFKDKFKNKSSNTLITQASAADAFNTEKEVKQKIKLSKKLKENEKTNSAINTTSISKKTADLNNRFTIKPKIDEVSTIIEAKNIAPELVIAPLNDVMRKNKEQLSTAKYGKRLPKAVGGKRETDKYLPYNYGYENQNTDSNPVYLNTGYNNLNSQDLQALYPQYDESSKHDPELAKSLREGIQLGRLSPNSVTSAFRIAGQKKNADGTYGSSSLKSMLDLQKEFPAMSAIAQKHGSLEFNPNHPEMIKDFEKSYNATYREETGKDFFLPGSARHAFDDDKKSGNWHLSIPLINRKSHGPLQQPSLQDRYNKEGDYYDFSNYITDATQEQKPNVPTTSDTPDPIKGIDPIKERKKNAYYKEGLNPWQTVGEMATLLDRYEPAPYIEDQGAKDALAMANKPRYTDIQPALNRTNRDLKARTRFNPNNASVNAQNATNAYVADTEAYGQKYTNDSQIDANFNNRIQELRMKAGANKANALDTLAQRTAKGHSAFTDRAINAVSLIGNKITHNLAENRAATLYQDMYPNFGYDGWETNWQGSSPALYAGNDYSTPRNKKEAELTYLKAKHDKDAMRIKELEKDDKKFGGKVNKLPKKMVKKLK